MDQGAPELCIPRFPSIGEAAHSPDERLDATAGYGGPFRNRAIYSLALETTSFAYVFTPIQRAQRES